MTDPHTDEAVRYVLGELDDASRRAFERELDTSEPLLAHVRELEEGLVAAALTAPRRHPSPRAWRQIEEAISRESGRRRHVVPAWWTAWWRGGWAAAAGLAIGMVCLLLMNRSTPSKPLPTTELVRSQPVVGTPNLGRQQPSPANPSNAAETHPALPSQPDRTQEIDALHRQVALLESRLARMSKSLTQQQAQLAETNRLKFFQLNPGAGTNTDTASPLSPRLQQALFLAMANELGWRTQGNEPSTAASEAAWFKEAGVDFVDLRIATNNPVSPLPPAESQLEQASASGASATNAMAGFVSGNDAFLAFDSTVVPTGSSVTFWATTMWGENLLLGNTILQNNPVVVAVPASAGGGNGTTLTIMATTPAGTVTTIGQVYSPPVSSP